MKEERKQTEADGNDLKGNEMKDLCELLRENIRLIRRPSHAGAKVVSVPELRLYVQKHTHTQLSLSLSLSLSPLFLR